MEHDSLRKAIGKQMLEKVQNINTKGESFGWKYHYKKGCFKRRVGGKRCV